MRNQPSDEIEYKGYSIKIYADDNAESPREWDNLGTMVCWHRNYNLGDINVFSSPNEFLEWANTQKGLIILPLFLYDHSGISISTGSFVGRAQHAEWDSGQIGFIYMTKEKAVKEFGKGAAGIKKATECLKSEVKTYDDYLTGNVYGFVTDDDSCSGYFGEPEKSGLIADAKESIDQMIVKQIEKEKKKFSYRMHVLKTFIRNHVPLTVRMRKLSQLS